MYTWTVFIEHPLVKPFVEYSPHTHYNHSVRCLFAWTALRLFASFAEVVVLNVIHHNIGLFLHLVELQLKTSVKVFLFSLSNVFLKPLVALKFLKTSQRYVQPSQLTCSCVNHSILCVQINMQFQGKRSFLLEKNTHQRIVLERYQYIISQKHQILKLSIPEHPAGILGLRLFLYRCKESFVNKGFEGIAKYVLTNHFDILKFHTIHILTCRDRLFPSLKIKTDF